MKFNEGFLAQMRDATRLLQTEGPMAATAAIQRALNAAPDGTPAGQAAGPNLLPPQEKSNAGAPLHDAEKQPDGADILTRARKFARGKWASSFLRGAVEDADVIDITEARNDAGGSGRGRFISASCTNGAGTRAYKLYIPECYKDEPLPLVVMLHGCTQNPDDFAAGTGMNALADEQKCLVAYPAQTKGANASHCWNWFQPGDQQRDRGEASIIADITREISRHYKVDTSRIYVAGLSAGGAMAAVMGASYPELYAAVGIHSGLAYGVARDMPSAFAAMKQRRGKAAPAQMQPATPAPLARAVPAIVFHGDRDHTVHPDNADQVLAQFVPASVRKDVRGTVQEGRTENGRTYTRTIIEDAGGSALGEKWTVHGAGHAWSGGDRSGSYTDPTGPSATREMLRFFYQHRNTARQ